MKNLTKWTKENVLVEALKYQTRTEFKEKVKSEIMKYNTMKDFRTKSKNAYNSMIRNGWRNIIPDNFVICYIGKWHSNRNFKIKQ